MNIEYKDHPTVKLADIGAGGNFIFNGGLYIKTDSFQTNLEKITKYLCVELERGWALNFAETLSVYPVAASIVIDEEPIIEPLEGTPQTATKDDLGVMFI